MTKAEKAAEVLVAWFLEQGHVELASICQERVDYHHAPAEPDPEPEPEPEAPE